jgi:hypothetical protein
MAWVKNAAKRVFQGLRRRPAREAGLADEGASPASKSQHLKTPGGPPGEARAGPTCDYNYCSPQGKNQFSEM